MQVSILTLSTTIERACSYVCPTGNEETTGDLFEVLGGWAAQTRWQRSGGFGFSPKQPFTPEDVIAKWKNITEFSKFYLFRYS